ARQGGGPLAAPDAVTEAVGVHLDAMPRDLAPALVADDGVPGGVRGEPPPHSRVRSPERKLSAAGTAIDDERQRQLRDDQGQREPAAEREQPEDEPAHRPISARARGAG